jgi:sulfite reductase (NADPH) hemoprotein beta-component
MLRVAIPYGTLSSKQLRAWRHVARKYDRGYGHFTTRQNIQYNWIKLAEAPDALEHLAKVGMHAIQTSGNCIRNVTSDQWAGVRPTRSPTRAYGPKSCGSGRRCIRNSRSCRASSRSRSPLRTTTAPRSRCTTSGCNCTATPRVKLGFEVLVGGGWAARHFIAKTINPRFVIPAIS